jgi:heptosyltransferase-2
LKFIIHTDSKPSKPAKSNKKILGINPGASYGSAKRWYPQEFVKVATELSDEYDIIIFGGASEVDIAGDIEQGLANNNITNYTNLIQLPLSQIPVDTSVLHFHTKHRGLCLGFFY